MGSVKSGDTVAGSIQCQQPVGRAGRIAESRRELAAMPSGPWAFVQPVRGRMECYSNGATTAVVDYAHTPDALEKVLHDPA
jgi:hypothetical protein